MARESLQVQPKASSRTQINGQIDFLKLLLNFFLALVGPSLALSLRDLV